MSNEEVLPAPETTPDSVPAVEAPKEADPADVPQTVPSAA